MKDERSARTLAYYDANARSFWEGTRDHDVSQNYDAFLRAMAGKPPRRILDLGCGPGRDVLHFKELGHDVVGLDGSARFCEMARALTGCEILHQDFLALSFPAEGPRFDGVFANASLFHVPTSELPRVLRILHDALAPRGVLFASNPRGDDREGFDGGERFGAFLTHETWSAYVVAAGFEEIEHYYRPPGRPRAQQPWLATVWRRTSTLTEAFEAGRRLFGEGRWFEAHEAWEERWRIETDEGARTMLQGLIQVAAAFHKRHVMNDEASARNLLAKGLAKLGAVEEHGFDLADILERARTL